MRQIIEATGKGITISLLLFFSLTTIAQGKSNEIDDGIHKDLNHTWYTSPWVWIIGAIIFILLLIILLKGSEKRQLKKNS